MLACDSERLKLTIDVVGFMPEQSFGLSNLKQQCDFICSRYPGKKIILNSGVQVPAAALFMYTRPPSEKEEQLKNTLEMIARTRHGCKRLSDMMRIESLSTLVHFCSEKRAGVEAVFDVARKDGELRGSSLRLAHELLLMLDQCRAINCQSTLVFGKKQNGEPHTILKVTSNEGTYIMESDWVMPEEKREVQGPDGVQQFGATGMDFVESECSAERTRDVHLPFEKWFALQEGEGPPYKSLTRIDKMILGKAISTLQEIPEITAKLLQMETSGGAGGELTSRFAKKGRERQMSGCRNLFVSLQTKEKTHEWTEFLVF